MKILTLQGMPRDVNLGEGNRVRAQSHDIERAEDGTGYFVRHRSSGRVFFVPLAMVVADVELDEEVADAGPAEAPVRPRGRGARAPKDPTPVQS